MASVRVLTRESAGMVRKHYLDSAWLAREPELAEREGRGMELARAAGIPAPRLVSVAGNSVLMTRLPGRVLLRPRDRQLWLDRMVELADRIHRVPVPAGFRPYRRYCAPELLTPPSWSRRPELWRAGIAASARPGPEFEAVFIHRDYHPWNILWSGSRISGVVDWVEACAGPAGIDLARLRLNVAILHGADAAESLPSAHPHWDLVDLLDGASGAARQPGLRLERYLELVLGRL